MFPSRVVSQKCGSIGSYFLLAASPRLVLSRYNRAGSTEKCFHKEHEETDGLVIVDGFFSILWHNVDEGTGKGHFNLGNTLLFGRATYDSLAGFWPPLEMFKNDNILAKGKSTTGSAPERRTGEVVQTGGVFKSRPST
jgi:hypothetical protein